MSMSMKKPVIGLLGVGALMGLLALAQDDPMQSLRDTVAELGLRVSRLEAAAGVGGGGAGASGATAVNPARTMVLVSVHLSNHGANNAQEIADLQQQCDALMNTVNASADAAAGAVGSAISNNTATYQRGGVSGWRGSAGGSERTAGGGLGFAQQAGDTETEARYATLHAIKLQQLQALQAASNRPLQILIGHNARVVFTLNSRIDLTEALNDIPIGATVTWTGNRISADDQSELWQIDSLKAVPTK